ncbi:ABC transporter ATP-binding protein [Bosea psychrotolerans]|uniref:Amino acid/amide ABC transporter ATP-binding protein 2 (HAAT family) n=1 Tax=Bosea psychrotolerans TaxID=1871628 RepID=A0A2S4M9G6_9HYPH|nr:ATP-binding cassette domain-containing protein [Bosea psychrotolerans]POR51378.1 amino acid/amide ABC transporter ATP-binding protein 2 (HAAT family) [Bosea psychrotolerans]
MPRTKDILEIKGLSAEIEGVQVLRKVDFALAEGATVALIGRNGAGKTSLLRAIMGFMKVTAGAIAFDGRPLRDVKPHERPRLGIGYAPEDRRLFSTFTIEENIRLPAEVMKLGVPEIARRLDGIYAVLPELADLRHRPAAGLSGGQGKMAALARALMIGNRVILLDEPFQGLAPVLANRYAAALRTLRDSHPEIALLITESNPSLLRNFAERAYAIERGEVTEVEGGLAASSLAAAGMH